MTELFFFIASIVIVCDFLFMIGISLFGFNYYDDEDDDEDEEDRTSRPP